MACKAVHNHYLDLYRKSNPGLQQCWGFPDGARGKERVCQCKRHKRHRFHPWVAKIPCRAWQPTPVFLPGQFNVQRSLAGYSPWVAKSQTWLKYLNMHTHKTTLKQSKYSRNVAIVQSCSTLWDPIDESTPGCPVLHYLPEFAQTHVHWVSDTTQPSHPLLPSSPPALNLSQDLFQSVGSSHQVAKVLGLQFQHQSFQWVFRTEYFRTDWSDLLAVQGTLKSLLQHISKASILQCSAFFMVQFAHLYMTTAKTTALPLTAKWCLCFFFLNTLSRFFIAFLPKCKRLLISWLQPPS